MEAFRETVQEEHDIPDLLSIEETYLSYQYQIRDILKECTIDWKIPDNE